MDRLVILRIEMAIYRGHDNNDYFNVCIYNRLLLNIL